MSLLTDCCCTDKRLTKHLGENKRLGRCFMNFPHSMMKSFVSPNELCVGRWLLLRWDCESLSKKTESNKAGGWDSVGTSIAPDILKLSMEDLQQEHTCSIPCTTQKVSGFKSSDL